MENIEKRTVSDVLEHHLTALGEGKVEEVLLDYAEDAFIISPNGTVRGKKELKVFFTHSVENVLPPGAHIEILFKCVEGELAYIMWRAELKFYTIPLGTDTFVIRNGKIVEQTFAGLMEKKDKK